MILVAPTSFKGTIGAAAAAAAMAVALREALPGEEIRQMPLSDGGPGLLDALRTVRDGSVEEIKVTGPFGAPVRARVLRMGADVVVESADACGLHLAQSARLDPLVASTTGVGELLLAAAGGAPGRIVVGLGGSATVDGGAGMARALGWRLSDDAGQALPPGGGTLVDLARIAPPSAPTRLPPVVALADVRSPLLGEAGAAAVFGPQKGADAEAVLRLERGLGRLAARIRADLGLEVARLPGAGAAGGLGAGLVAFAGAELVPGAEWLLSTVGFDDMVARASLVITGEGRYDAQSTMGKVTGVVVERAARRDVPVLLLVGRLEGALPHGVYAVSGGARVTPEQLARRAAEWAPRLLMRKRRG